MGRNNDAGMPASGGLERLRDMHSAPGRFGNDYVGPALVVKRGVKIPALNGPHG